MTTTPESPRRRTRLGLAAAALALVAAGAATAQDRGKPDFPPFDKVSDGYERVVSTTEGKTFYGIWVNNKTGDVLAELPRGYERQKHFFAMTLPYGERFAGRHAGDLYTYWKRYDKRLALCLPNLGTRSTGDQESKASIETIFTDRVLLDLPIVCMGPSGQPVIDLDAMLVGQASRFYGGLAAGINPRLVKVTKAKAFPQNVELSFEAPTAGGQLKVFSYSISKAPGKTGYKPRRADERIGYFTTSYQDLGKYQDDKVSVHYINRWHLQKADPKLKMSPPKEPIIFYVHHTVPVRYRRWVREGVLYWNDAFEQIGIANAIEVRYQDKSTGAHMDKDPEDVRYNFLRWLNNNVGTAIGPSRVDPMTGQILDADIVLTDGWIRHFWYQANELLPQVAMENFDDETIAWLEQNPQWDPRVRLAAPERRAEVEAELKAMAAAKTHVCSDPNHDHGHETNDHLHVGREWECMASRGKAMDMSLMALHLSMLNFDDAEQEGDMLDGIPEWFAGPMLADLVCHEVGHTLGLRHNFKASSIYSMEEINSEDVKGSKPFTASVMDYSPVNINMDDGPMQGDYAMIGIGPYDYWAIEYGYTFDDPKKVLSRVGEDMLPFGSDEDTTGPDPLARRYDFSSNPIEYAESTMRLVDYHREQILDRFVKDGDSWAKARRGYGITLSQHTNVVAMMANWIGGAYVQRLRKGDADGAAPVTPVEVEKQREALEFVIANTFFDDAFGLSPELLQHMTIDRLNSGWRDEPTWNVSDRIMGVQASVMTMLLNPTTLRRVYDNEFLAGDDDMLTLPELLAAVRDAAWLELDSNPNGDYDDRNPMITNFRRNLQREYLDRMIALATGNGMRGAAGKTVSNLVTLDLRELHNQMGELLEDHGDDLDRYTLGHLAEAHDRIERALDAMYIRSN